MNKVKNYQIIVFFISIILVLICSFAGLSMYMICAFALWINMIAYCTVDISSRGTLFAFLIAFFTFLMGRELMEIIGLHEIETFFEEVYNEHAGRLVLLSLVFIFLGYVAANRVGFGHNNFQNCYNGAINLQIREVSSKIFLVTYIFNLYQIVDVVLFVVRHGYLTFYTSYVSSVPYIIGKIGDMCIISFWLYLATMPTKNESIKLIRLYILYLLITLGTGKRFTFVAGLLTLFVYYLYRNKDSDLEEWLGKKEKRIIILIVPVIMIGMVLINVIRFGNQIISEDILNGATDFFYSQGVSVNFIKRALKYEQMLPSGKVYTFGSFIEFLHNNIISRAIGIESLSGNNVEHAMNGFSMQHAMSYVTMGSYYLSGHGLGSSYIAELFHDFRYIGVIIGNFIYGFVICKLINFEQRNVYINGVSLIALNSILLAPRGSADGFLTVFLDMSVWGTFILIWIITNILYSRNR